MSHIFFIQSDDDKVLQWENLSEEQAKTLYTLTQKHLSKGANFGYQKDPNPIRYYIGTVEKRDEAGQTHKYLFATKENANELASQFAEEYRALSSLYSSGGCIEIPKEAFDLMSKYLPVYTAKVTP